MMVPVTFVAHGIASWYVRVSVSASMTSDVANHSPSSQVRSFRTSPHSEAAPFSNAVPSKVPSQPKFALRGIWISVRCRQESIDKRSL